MQMISVDRNTIPTRRNVDGFYRYKAEVPTWQQQWKQICAILPMYLPDDINGTIIYYDDAPPEIVYSTCGYVVEQLMQYLMTSSTILQKRSAQLLGVKDMRRTPMMHSCGLCLMPVKSRKPRSKSDAASGYVVMGKINATYSVKKERRPDTVRMTDLPEHYPDTATIIAFDSGLKLKVMDSRRTVNSNLALCLELMARRHELDDEELAALDKGQFEIVFANEDEQQRKHEEMLKKEQEKNKEKYLQITAHML